VPTIPSISPSHPDSPAIHVPETVVVPLDGSATAQAALPLGRLLAARFDAMIQTVTVGPPAGEIEVDLRLPGGDPVDTLLRHLTAVNRPLVCMASHGHGGLRRRLIGSVTEGLIRRCAAPVVVCGPHATTPTPPRTILVGVSWSPRANLLLDTIAAWAPLLDAACELAHVRTPTAVELYTARTTGRTPADQPDLARLRRDLNLRGVRTRIHALIGTDATEALLHLAERLEPPVLIAIDTHHLNEPADHDVAYQLIRHSPWPILTI
jgi:nucleotide-binding universal stress UspA family protein